MNNTQTTNTNEAKISYDFTKDLASFTNDSFCDYNYKKDYVLSIRLSYGEKKQNDSIYNDYLEFLKNDLKIINDKNEINVKTKKANSYIFVFKKTNEYDNYFTQLSNYLEKNIENLDKNTIEKITNLLNAKNDLYNDNFTISNFELTKNKIKDFITFCLNKKLIER